MTLRKTRLKPDQKCFCDIYRHTYFVQELIWTSGLEEDYIEPGLNGDVFGLQQNEFVDAVLTTDEKAAMEYKTESSFDFFRKLEEEKKIKWDKDAIPRKKHIAMAHRLRTFGL